MLADGVKYGIGSGLGREKFQGPSTKLQRNFKFQISNSVLIGALRTDAPYRSGEVAARGFCLGRKAARRASSASNCLMASLVARRKPAFRWKESMKAFWARVFK